MKNINTKLFAFTLFAALCVLLASCYQPSPIYGAWSDNSGNKISFADDGSFSATIVDPDNPSTKINYSGAYTVIENVISFSKDDGSIVTEW
ncbi:MAG: hypothetical protein IJM40_04765, partial [Synergistaceae bacterium]|nr:hypothetical protein [Synergistaceae bacterium]